MVFKKKKVKVKSTVDPEPEEEPEEETEEEDDVEEEIEEEETEESPKSKEIIKKPNRIEIEDMIEGHLNRTVQLFNLLRNIP